jgi:hypothetical protein
LPPGYRLWFENFLTRKGSIKPPSKKKKRGKNWPIKPPSKKKKRGRNEEQAKNKKILQEKTVEATHWKARTNSSMVVWDLTENVLVSP